MTPPPPRSRRWPRLLAVGAAAIAAYLAIAYVLMPGLWKARTTRDPALDASTTVTVTGSGIPGDALNVALVASEPQVHLAMHAAGWYPANPITLSSSIDIVGDTVLRRQYDEAPVSSLYLYGRKEDLAFEKPVGDSPKKRNHVRFWRMADPAADGRPRWIGAATFDERVGFSHTTGEVTHHTGPDIDAERDRLIGDLQAATRLERVEWIDPFQPKPEGKNGGGDPWRTDRRMAVGVLKP